ncbi:MAG: hypothetical protein ABI895_16915 [Deltaproteobacteria bacterium]
MFPAVYRLPGSRYSSAYCSAALLLSLLMPLGCRGAALALTSDKKPELSTSPLAASAKEAFRSTLLAGDYTALDLVAEKLTAAYLASPHDPDLALYIAHAHFWRVAERTREPAQRALITDHLAIAELYFVEATGLRPNDHRIPGWLGGVKMALGRIHGNERKSREGYFLIEDGVNRFPEFNHFSKSYILSNLPASHARFRDGLEAMWKSIEVCNAAGIDRRAPDYRAFYRQAADLSGSLRVCHNLPVAPHNFEGFFLHNGDVLVKAGEPEAAKVMYANARLAPSFAEWPYREALEERIRTAQVRAEAFQNIDQQRWPEMMAASSMACTGCHQR